MKKIALLFLMCIGATYVYAQQYTINANITGFKDGTKFFLHDLESQTDIDSAVIANNKLTFTGKLPYNPESVWFCAFSNNQFYYTNLFIGKGKLTVTGDIADFPFYLKITGSADQDIYTILNNKTKAYYKQRNVLVNEVMALKGDSVEKSEKIWRTISGLDSACDAIRKQFIKENLNSYAALNELNYLRSKYSRDTLQQMYNLLKPLYKQSKYGQRIATYLKIGDILKKGDTYADFEALDKDGKSHKISDIKGKYILLDFSETGCGPCILSLKDLRDIKQQYADKITIITFSGDAGKDTWLYGLNRDKPDWLSLWDGKGRYGKTILKYGITGYPTFCIINPDGKIVSLSTGFGDQGSLENSVKQILNK